MATTLIIAGTVVQTSGRGTCQRRFPIRSAPPALIPVRRTHAAWKPRCIQFAKVFTAAAHFAFTIGGGLDLLAEAGPLQSAQADETCPVRQCGHRRVDDRHQYHRH